VNCSYGLKKQKVNPKLAKIYRIFAKIYFREYNYTTVGFMNFGKRSMKKVVNIVTLLVMVIGNILTPFANAT